MALWRRSFRSFLASELLEVVLALLKPPTSSFEMLSSVIVFGGGSVTVLRGDRCRCFRSFRSRSAFKTGTSSASSVVSVWLLLDPWPCSDAAIRASSRLLRCFLIISSVSFPSWDLLLGGIRRLGFGVGRSSCDFARVGIMGSSSRRFPDPRP
jgi:hypothetical protein